MPRLVIPRILPDRSDPPSTAMRPPPRTDFPRLRQLASVYKHEALNHFIVFGLAHFDHIVREFVNYYHDFRPHQGIGNRLIGAEDSDGPPLIESIEQLECESRLGGLLKTYRRAA